MRKDAGRRVPPRTHRRPGPGAPQKRSFCGERRRKEAERSFRRKAETEWCGLCADEESRTVSFSPEKEMVLAPGGTPPPQGGVLPARAAVGRSYRWRAGVVAPHAESTESTGMARLGSRAPRKGHTPHKRGRAPWKRGTPHTKRAAPHAKGAVSRTKGTKKGVPAPRQKKEGGFRPPQLTGVMVPVAVF